MPRPLSGFEVTGNIHACVRDTVDSDQRTLDTIKNDVLLNREGMKICTELIAQASETGILAEPV